MKFVKNLTRCAVAFATLLTLATLAPCAQANLLQTGDFELGHDVLLTSDPVTNSLLLPNWTFSKHGQGALAQVTTEFSTCPTGECFVAISNNRSSGTSGALTQNFGASAGQRLEIDFDYSSFILAGDPLGVLQSTLSVALDGQQLVINPLDHPTALPRTVIPFEHHYTGYATAADLNTFSVDYFLSDTSHLYLDNFSIKALPEPTSSALALGGLLALFVAGRRKSV